MSKVTSASATTKGMYRVYSLNTQVSNTGNTTENTIITTTIPGNSIGANGSFHIQILWSRTNNANAITGRLKFNGTLIATYLPSNQSGTTYTTIRNRNSLTSQASGNASSTSNAGFGSYTTAAIGTYSFDTSSPITVTLTMQNFDGADTGSTEGFEILALY